MIIVRNGKDTENIEMKILNKFLILKKKNPEMKTPNNPPNKMIIVLNGKDTENIEMKTRNKFLIRIIMIILLNGKDTKSLEMKDLKLMVKMLK